MSSYPTQVSIFRPGRPSVPATLHKLADGHTIECDCPTLFPRWRVYWRNGVWHEERRGQPPRSAGALYLLLTEGRA